MRASTMLIAAAASALAHVPSEPAPRDVPHPHVPRLLTSREERHNRNQRRRRRPPSKPKGQGSQALHRARREQERRGGAA